MGSALPPLHRPPRSPRARAGSCSGRGLPRDTGCPFRSSLGEGLPDLVEPLDEAVDLLWKRVEVEAGTRRGGHAKLGHEGLVAVVSRANGDALPVQDLRDV